MGTILLEASMGRDFGDLKPRSSETIEAKKEYTSMVASVTSLCCWEERSARDSPPKAFVVCSKLVVDKIRNRL